jgi:hypothetical protein
MLKVSAVTIGRSGMPVSNDVEQVDEGDLEDYALMIDLSLDL